jgi:nucleotide-binding universal stress UspA family protein
MSEPRKPFVIVVATDYSETGELAFDQAMELAAGRPGTELHVLHVLPYGLPALAPELDLRAPGSTIPAIDDAAQQLIAHVEKRVDDFMAAHPARPDTMFRAVPHLRLDTPALEIAQLATDLEADLVVVGTHGRRAIARLILGSVAEVAVRLSPCPVLVVRPKASPVPAPTIEPPCPRCVETRIASGRREFWCEQHRERHGHRHTYHQDDRAAAETNMPLVVR